MANKICTKCGKLKPLSEFYIRKRRGRNEYHERCKKCMLDVKTRKSFNEKSNWSKWICPICKKSFWMILALSKQALSHYCSRKCYLEGRKLLMKGKESPTYKNGYYFDSSGYKMIPDEFGNYRQEHILIVENVLGRKLKDDEIVHHINLNKSHNQNNNLLICNRPYHYLIHWNMQRKYAELFLGG